MDEQRILIDKTGKEIIKQDGLRLVECSDENLISYCLDDKLYGYMNLKGEKVIKLASNIKEPSTFFNGYATFKNNEWNYGVINTKGEIVIRAKYQGLEMLDNCILYNEDGKLGFLSYSGDIIKRARYEKMVPFFGTNKYTFAKDGDDWILIDKKGEDTKKVDVETIYFDDFSYNDPTSLVSDYLDIEAEVKNIMSVLNEDGTIDKMTFDMTPREFANVYNMDYKVNDLQGKNNVVAFISTLKYIDARAVGIMYDREVIKADYKREWVSNRWGGYYDNVIDGYSYNNIVEIVELRYFSELKGKLADRKKEVLETVWTYLENNGYIKLERWKRNGVDFETTLYEKNNHKLLVEIRNGNILGIWTMKK